MNTLSHISRALLVAVLLMLPVEAVMRPPGVEFAWVDGSAKPRPARPVDDAPGWTVGTAPDDAAHEQWDVSAVPFAFLVAADGVIVSKRLINSRRDVEDQLAEALPTPRVITVERGAVP